MSVPIINPPTFTRSSVAYLSNGTQVAANVPRFEQGKFGKAVLVEEGTENLENPDNLTAWSGSSGTRVVTRIGQYKFNVKFYTQTIGSFLYEYFALTVGNYYTLSAYVKGIGNTIGKQIRLQSMQENAYGNPVTLTAEYQKISVTLQATATSRAIGFIGVPDNTFVAGDEIEIAFVLFERKPYSTSFTDGTRAAERLTIPTEGVLNPQEGTIECWIYENTTDVRNVSRIIVNGRDATNSVTTLLILKEATKNYYTFRVRNEDNTVTVNADSSPLSVGWHHLAAVWLPDTIKLYIDGICVATTPKTFVWSSFNPLLSIGSSLSAGEQFNSLIDDLRISNRARTDAEILAAYQSGQPLPYDANTTWLSRFDCYNTIDRPTGIKISVGNTTPEYPVINDIWIDTN